MRPRFFLAATAAVLMLTGCTQPAEPQPEPTESFAPVPETVEETAEPLVPNAIEPDTTLIVRATATAPNGAVLSLEYHVHRAVRWDDVAAQTLPAALIADCAALSEAIAAEEAWSFTRTNLTAIPPADSTLEWPEGAGVSVLPAATSVYSAGRGILSPDAEVVDGPLCETPKSFTTLGRGALSVGIAGDADIFTAWARHRYGFDAGSTGVTLTDCSFELTPLGSSLGGGVGWTPVATATSCSTGATVEAAEY